MDDGFGGATSDGGHGEHGCVGVIVDLSYAVGGEEVAALDDGALHETDSPSEEFVYVAEDLSN